jgi:SAM-dependent methyltransferase
MSDFDAHVDSYRASVQSSIAFAGQEVEYFSQRKTDHLIDVTSRLVGDPRRMSFLDVGCGVGLTDVFLASQVGRLVGVDEAHQALVSAVDRNPLVRHCTGDGRALPFRSGSFDVVFAVCVVHHIPVDRRSAFVAELRRVVRPGGLVVVFEHNALNPLTRVAVNRCEFDVDVKLLTRRGTRRLLDVAGLDPVEARDIIFTTFDRPWARRLDRLLARLPFGAQHYVAARRW